MPPTVTTPRVVWLRRKGSIYASGGGVETARAPRRKVVTTTVEHSATRELCAQLKREGFDVIEVPVGNQDEIDGADALRRGRTGRVVREERIEQQPHAFRRRHQERRVSEPRDLQAAERGP